MDIFERFSDWWILWIYLVGGFSAPSVTDWTNYRLYEIFTVASIRFKVKFKIKSLEPDPYEMNTYVTETHCLHPLTWRRGGRARTGRRRRGRWRESGRSTAAQQDSCRTWGQRKPVLWIRIQNGSVFSNLADPKPHSEYRYATHVKIR